MAVDITLIPGVMKRKGWLKGSALMSRWFSLPAADNEAGALGTPDTTTITIDWVLGVPRAKTIYDSIFSERIWAGDKVAKEIKNTLTKAGALTLTSFAFPVIRPPLLDLELTPTEMDSYYVTYKSFKESVLGTLDDLYAALANFNFRLIPRGIVRLKGKTPAEGYVFDMDQVGIYIWDTYDFVGDQSLGYWDTSKDSVGKTPLSGESVTNESFRNWRTANGKGGDFLIYSDVKWVPLAKAETIDLK